MTVEESWVPQRADVLVVGGGMGGLAAAVAASEAGAQVVVVEKGVRPGGGCHWATPPWARRSWRRTRRQSSRYEA